MTDKRFLIVNLIGCYLELYPDQRPLLDQMISFCESHKGFGLFDRFEAAGHFTASAIVTENSGTHILLLWHRALGKWLQPGGHVDRDDCDILSAARREIAEETGYGPEDYDVLTTECGCAVIDMDSHYIPRNQAKGESEHWHHDIRFVFRLKPGVGQPRISDRETAAYRWVDAGSLPTESGLERVSSRINKFTKLLK